MPLGPYFVNFGPFGMIFDPHKKKSPNFPFKVESWSEENCYCSEPVYISEPGEAEEDSGLLICSLLWAKPSVTTTAILILSARDLSPVARLESESKANS